MTLQAVDEGAILGRLGQHPVLRHLHDGGLTRLVRQAVVQSFAERATVFEQGDDRSSLMAVARGYVKLSVVTLNGREVVLDLAGPGSVFGELAALNGWPRSAAAVALTDCTLLAIDAGAFSRALAGAPEALMEMVRLLSRRLRRTTEQMTDTLDLPAPARLAKALLELAALHSRPVRDGLQIELALSQRELGGMSGLIRESINRHLSNWRDAGWLRLSDRTITLTDIQALRALLRDYEPV
ncbi:MAG: Crp/Fnr family transcriptional regulator [Acetobacteraceae bacterium]